MSEQKHYGIPGCYLMRYLRVKGRKPTKAEEEKRLSSPWKKGKRIGGVPVGILYAFVPLDDPKQVYVGWSLCKPKSKYGKNGDEFVTEVGVQVAIQRARTITHTSDINEYIVQKQIRSFMQCVQRYFKDKKMPPWWVDFEERWETYGVTNRYRSVLLSSRWREGSLEL